MGLFSRRESVEDDLRRRGIELADPERPCSGCAHSASGAPYPGHPSGERPCGFCVRNPGQAYPFGEKGPRWYDGKTRPFKTPMDCYIATDRLRQQRIFDVLDEIRDGHRKIEKRGDGLNFARACGWKDGERPITPCCKGGGPAETGGHAYDCIMVIGTSFS